MSKVCPLFFASGADLDDFECRPDLCAWAYEDGCAVTTLARCLDGLNEKDIIAWIEKEEE